MPNPDDLRQFIILSEGYETHVYTDNHGHPTIGIGYNLDRAGAREQLTRLGVDYDRVRSGAIDLTRAQVEALYRVDVQRALAAAQRIFPNFGNIGNARQIALVDMIFNLGE